MKDKVAITGIGTTGFFRDGGGRSRASLALEACTQAVTDAGLSASDINGVCGTAPEASYVVSALGLRDVTHFGNQSYPFVFSIVDAAHAIFAGACDTVLAYHAVYRSPAISRSASSDPFRRGLGFAGALAPAPTRHDPEDIAGSVGYAAWASRYLYEWGVKRDYLGYVAVNDRSNAMRNPLAVMREPLTLDEYLGARMVREPLCLLDMDVPVDGADAFVLTTTERAKDLQRRPVLIHAASVGVTAPAEELSTVDLGHHGQHVVVESLRAKSDLWIQDVDVYFPYDGFSFIALAWIENTGWCAPGEVADFIDSNWDPKGNRLMIDGRIPVNSHGGALSEGGTQGSGHIREAVVQLRGEASGRQVQGARTALVTPGGFFFNAQGLILRSD
jgi:acetyl-CoA acetyltransferase